MGTSTAYGGPNGRTPLIPSWLGSDSHGTLSDGSEGELDPNALELELPPPPNRPMLPADADPNRFRGARANFTRFATSGGSDRASLGRAVSGYISKASGGAHQAAQRMGASRGAGARFLGFLLDAQTQGPREALRALNLEKLAGRPIAEVLVGLADHICPNAGTIDDGIAREAYIETIIELTALGITDLDALTSDQIKTVFELYTTHAIETRICNDIGASAVMIPVDAQAAHRVQAQLRDFIRGGVSDALAKMAILTTEYVQSFVDIVYESAFAILQEMGEAEAVK